VDRGAPDEFANSGHALWRGVAGWKARLWRDTKTPPLVVAAAMGPLNDGRSVGGAAAADTPVARRSGLRRFSRASSQALPKKKRRGGNRRQQESLWPGIPEPVSVPR